MSRLPAVATRVADAVRLWLDAKAAYGAKPLTITNYRAGGERLLRFLPVDTVLDDLDRETLLRFRAYLTTANIASPVRHRGTALRPETVASYMRAVINFLNWCAENGLLNFPLVTKGLIPRVPRNPKRSPDRGEVAKLLAMVERPEPGNFVPAFTARSRALLLVLLDTGLRVSEVSNLDIDDYDPARGSLHVRDSKGGNSRFVFLSPQTGTALDLWAIRPRRQLMRRAAPASANRRLYDRYLLALGETPLPENGGGPLFVDRVGQRMSGHSIRIWLRHLCERAGVPVYRPHDLRRLYITQATAAGMPLPQVMQQVGHSNPKTTMKYIVSDAELQRNAAISASPLRNYRN